MERDVPNGYDAMSISTKTPLFMTIPKCCGMQLPGYFSKLLRKKRNIVEPPPALIMLKPRLSTAHVQASHGLMDKKLTAFSHSYQSNTCPPASLPQHQPPGLSAGVCTADEHCKVTWTSFQERTNSSRGKWGLWIYLYIYIYGHP